MAWALVAGMTLMVGAACAEEARVFDFGEEL